MSADRLLRLAGVLVALLGIQIASAQRFPVVRVGLASMGPANRMRIGSDAPFALYDSENRAVASWKAGDSVEVVAGSGSFAVGSKSLAAGYFSTSGTYLKLNGPKIGRKYRGWLHFSARTGNLVPVNEVALETYLMGVVPCEMGPTSPMEALKAQAVAARTYTLTRIGSFTAEGYDVDDTTRCHTYRGVDVEDPRTNEAVRLTSNQVLIYNGRPISAMYATVSGGVTASASEAFVGGGAPYLQSIKDVDAQGKPYAVGSAWFTWSLDVTPVQLQQVLLKAGVDLGAPKLLGVDARSASGRVSVLRVEGDKGQISLPGTDLRRIFGTEVLRSTLFDVETTATGWRLNGRGWGHGVGMCQAGAKGRANAGQAYPQILAAYYVGAQLYVYRGSPIELATRGSWVDRKKYAPGNR